MGSKEDFINLSAGKMSGLRRITDKGDRFKVLALDQSNSFKKFLRALYQKHGKNVEPSFNDILQAKLEITEVLAPQATAVLLDVTYGARQGVNTAAVPRDVGLIVRLEASKDPGIAGEPEPGWSVAQIKEMGAAAVKLLVYMDTADKKATDGQMKFVKQVCNDCAKNDILLMTEELSYPRAGEDKKTPEFIKRKPQNIFESSVLLGPHTDILKLEFPANMQAHPPQEIESNLKKLNEKASKPWVLLSAGEKFDVFEKQVEMTMKAGASGIMAGRAIFQEYFEQPDPAARRNFLKTVGLDRMKRLSDLVDKYAVPWPKRYNITKQDLASAVAPEWYKKGKATKAVAAAKGDY